MQQQPIFHFDDTRRECVITEPVTPRPWINYLGNRRLNAFISQNAGGLLWLHEPFSRRLSRYHYVAPPGDRPGFYVYLRDRRTGAVWNPHFAPTCTPLTGFECRHAPGLTSFRATHDGVQAEVTYGMPPDDDVMLWQVRLTNAGSAPVALECVSYLEFGLLEFLREAIGWCYLKNHFGLVFDPATDSIRYDYHVFEAPATPAMRFGCTVPVTRWDCSRDAFIGRTGSLESPAALKPGQDLTNSDIPSGGHACAALAVDIVLAPGESREFAYVFTVADTWPQADALAARYRSTAAAAAGIAAIRATWNGRFDTFQAATGDAAADRFINTWNPYNSFVTLEQCRIISTDHMGTDGLRYRDTSQDALAVAHLEPEYATSQMRRVFAQQTRDGGGCFAFFPNTRQPTTDTPHRCDNPVWPVFTVRALLAETGNADFLGEVIPYRDGGEASVLEHLHNGLRHIYARRGPHGLPTLFDCDWNDSLAMFADPKAETVMLGLQFVQACAEFAELAARVGQDSAAAWARQAAAEMTAALDSDNAWDGAWYRRLLLSSGKTVGSAANRQGRIYLDEQPWAVTSGVGRAKGRGAQAMQSVRELLNSECGLAIIAPPYRGFPEPEDPPLGSNPGSGENGGVFCHANTWAIIAECMLGHGDTAWEYYTKLLPENVIARFGAAHYEREPYVYVSSLVGPGTPAFGRAGISWLTGTASWMYIAVTQYIIGVRPTFEGLRLEPCLPRTLRDVHVRRRFRGCDYDIHITNEGLGRPPAITVDGLAIAGSLLPLPPSGRCEVRCRL